MTDNSLTLALGDSERVPLDLFARGVKDFHLLVRGLTQTLAPGAGIVWDSAKLDDGSAFVTASASGSAELPILAVIEGYDDVGRHLAEMRPLPYPPAVVRPALRLAALSRGGGLSVVRFVTESDEAEIRREPAVMPPARALQGAYGAIEGRVQTLSDSGGLRFVLYESLRSRAISCYVSDEHRESLRDAWGHRAVVEGWVTRDSLTGLPVSMRRVSKITVLADENRGSFRDARGALPRLLPSEPTYLERLREYRNAE